MKKVDKNRTDKKCMKKTDKKGFTLIELLAIIIILSLILGIVVYVVTDTIKEAKNRSYKVTYNNIVNIASEFVLENIGDKFYWREYNGVEYTCVSVQDLIDGGYYKGDVLESNLSSDKKVKANDYVYLERDLITKNVEIRELLWKEADGSQKVTNCDDMKKSNIRIAVRTCDGSVEINGWSKCKRFEIKYHLMNLSNSDDLDKYNYGYIYDYFLGNKEDIEFGSEKFEKNIVVVGEEVTENGTVTAVIKNEKNEELGKEEKTINGIDNVGPIIDTDYKGSSIVNKEVEIPLIVTDRVYIGNEIKEGGVGVDVDSFTVSDLKITIGGTPITNGVTLKKDKDNKYVLKIENTTNTGRLKISVAKGNVLDLLGNPNDVFTYEKIYFENRKVIIKYNVNGGTLSDNEYNWKVDKKSGIILKSDNSILTTEIFYNQVIGKDGLFNYNNPNYINIKRENHIVEGGAEWKCLSNNCKRNTYDQSNEKYTSSDFCDVKSNDCTVELGVNWISVYTINYVANGASNVPSPQTKIHGIDLTLSSTIPTRTGYTFKGWSISETSSDVSYQPRSSYKENKSITLYAVWDVNKYAVNYVANGASNVPSSQTKIHGIDLTLSSTIPTKDGYDFKGWSISETSSTVSYQPGSSYKKNEPITLYAVWSVKKYKVTIKYNINGGTLSDNKYKWKTDKSGIILESDNSIVTTEIVYNQEIGKDGLFNYNNSNYINISKTGYSGVSGAEWICLSGNCKRKTYDQSNEKYTSSDFCDAKSKDCTVVLGVNWKGNKYKVDYEANIFSPLDSSRGLRSEFDYDGDGRGDYMLHVLYDHFTSNLTFKTVTSTSRLNNLLLGLNPLNFSAGEKYEITLTYVSGGYEKHEKDIVAMLVGQTSKASCMVNDSSCWNKKVLLQLPTSEEPVFSDTITIGSSGNAYLKQIMSSSYPLDVKFIDYIVNVSIRKVIEGVTTQTFVCGNNDKYKVPSNSSLPVKLGYESFDETGWKLMNENKWGAIVNKNTVITNCTDHKVYANLVPKRLSFTFDGNGRDIGLEDYKTSYEYDAILPNTSVLFDELAPWNEGGIEKNPAKNYAKIDTNAFEHWRFKIKPFANSDEVLWFGCPKSSFSEDASGHKYEYVNICGGQSNPTLGWYKEEELELFYTRGLSVGGINTANFLGFDVIAVAQWKQ